MVGKFGSVDRLLLSMVDVLVNCVLVNCMLLLELLVKWMMMLDSFLDDEVELFLEIGSVIWRFFDLR